MHAGGGERMHDELLMSLLIKPTCRSCTAVTGVTAVAELFAVRHISNINDN
jgi:hypothetical protein